MKISVAWIFDHIDADWSKVSIFTLVEKFNKTTAEIEGVTPLTHVDVTWTFDSPIIGVMSDGIGNLETASTFELGHPQVNYPASAFLYRGLESGDGYTVSGNEITVSLGVTEAGCWIRVVTEGSTGVPDGGTTLALLLSGVVGLLGAVRRRRG